MGYSVQIVMPKKGGQNGLNEKDIVPQTHTDLVDERYLGVPEGADEPLETAELSHPGCVVALEGLMRFLLTDLLEFMLLCSPLITRTSW